MVVEGCLCQVFSVHLLLMCVLVNGHVLCTRTCFINEELREG